MVWDPTHPATGSGVVSAGLRDNFAALDTLLVAPLTALANNQLLMKAAGPVVAGVPAGTNGYVLTLVGGVPLWQPGFVYPLLAPDGTVTAPSYAFAGLPGMGLFRDPNDRLTLVGADGATLALITTADPDWGATGFAVDDALGGWYAFGTSPPAFTFLGFGNTGPNYCEIVVDPGGDRMVISADGHLDFRSRMTLTPFTESNWRFSQDGHFFLAGGVRYPTMAAPATPPTGTVITYAKTDKKLYAKDDAGVETPLGGGGGVSAVRLSLEQATLPDGTAGNVPPELVREKSTGVLSGAPSPTRTYARFAGDSAAVMESLLWSFVLPSNYGSGGTIRLKWKAAVATTGAVIWKAGAAPVIDGSTDDDAVAFTAVTTASASTAPATQGHSVEVMLALTTTGFAALRWVTVFVARDPVAAADTMTGTGTAGDAVLMGVQFEYTAA